MLGVENREKREIYGQVGAITDYTVSDVDRQQSILRFYVCGSRRLKMKEPLTLGTSNRLGEYIIYAMLYQIVS